jgi:phosphate transport system permease protein
MAEINRKELKSAAETRKLVESSLRSRYARERRFQAYGIAAVVASVAFVGFFFITIIAQGHTAFFQTYVKLDIDFDPVVIDPEGGREPQALSSANYQKLVKTSLEKLFPDVSGRSDKRTLNSMVSTGAIYELRDLVLADASLIGKTRSLWFPADDELDMYFKGRVDVDVDETSRRFNDKQVLWAESLREQGRIEKL